MSDSQAEKITIELGIPINTPTGKVSTLTLRRAKVRDLKQVQRLGLSDAEQELMLLALLTEQKLTPEDMEELDLGDYAKVQRVFRQLVGATG